MAAKLLPLIPEDAFNLTPEPPEFEALVAQELGAAATPQDGFDSLFLTATDALADAAPDLAALDADHARIAGNFPEVQDTPENALTVELAPAVTEGDGAVQDYQTGITPASG
jgi:hypothetical protein